MVGLDDARHKLGGAVCGERRDHYSRFLMLCGLLVAALCACEGKPAQQSVTNPGAGQAQRGAEAGDGALAEVRAAPAPAGVNGATWRMLQEELARVIEAVGRASVSTDAGGAALRGRDPRGAALRGRDPGSAVFQTALKNADYKSALPGRTAGAEARPTGQRWTSSKTTSSPPVSGGSKAVLTLDVSTGNGTLKWGLYLAGDYNQDGQVSAADLTPLGQRFGEVSPGGSGAPFPADSSGAMVDGSADGVIGLTDIAPIGQNYGRRVMGYRVYRSHDAADVPQVAADANGPGAELLADVPLADAIVEAGKRKRFEHALSDPAAGWFFWVRPYDGAEEGTPSNSCPPTGADNLAPIAVITAQPNSGLAPLDLQLSGFASIDLDGIIVKYEWDYDGPLNGEQWVDTGGTGWVAHTYDAGGDYLPALRVTDNAGAQHIAYAPVKARQANPPNATLVVDLPTGSTVHHVVFDASESWDPDGPVVKWEWDWNNDGIYDYDSGTVGTAEFYYYDPGTYTTTVRVMDQDGLTGTAQIGVTVSKGKRWYLWPVITTTHSDATGNGYLASPQGLVDLNGVPAMLLNYYRNWNNTIDPRIDHSYLSFTRCVANDGSYWAHAEVIDDGSRNSFNRTEGDMCVVKGNPYVIYNWSYPVDPSDTQQGTVSGSCYLRSADNEGKTWPAATDFPPGLDPGNPVIVNGVPCVSVSNGLMYAADELGTMWLDPVPREYLYGEVVIIGGYPCSFGFVYDSGLIFSRAVDVEGKQWPVNFIRVVRINEVYGASLVEAGGNPAMDYLDPAWSRLMYVRASQPDGGAWPEPKTLSYNLTLSVGIQMLIVDGRPVILYAVKTGYNQSSAVMLAANDAAGDSWSLPSPLPIDMSLKPTLWEAVSLGDRLGWVYYTKEGPDGGTHTQTIYYATYY